MAELDNFLSDIKTSAPKAVEVEDFLSDIKREKEPSPEDFLGDISVETKGVTERPAVAVKASDKTEVRESLLSPSAKTKAGKLVGKAVDFLNTSINALNTEGEKLVVKAVDDVRDTNNYIGRISDEIKGLDFVDVLMTPAGQYWASLGAKVPTPSMVLEKLAPNAFELPKDWDALIPTEGGIPVPQYPPWVVSFLHSVNGKPNEALSKFSQMVFLDSLAFGGMDKILGKIMPKIEAAPVLGTEVSESVSQTLSDVSKMSPESLTLYNRELAVAQASKTPGALEITKSVPLAIEENARLVNGVKYSTFDGTKNVANSIKKASKGEEYIARKSTSIEIEAPNTVIPKDTKIKDILPNPGEVDFVWTPAARVKQAASTVASPWNYARPVFDEVSLHKRMLQNLEREGIGYVSKYFGKFSEDQLSALGAVKDKLQGYETVLENWTKIFGKKSDEATAALEAYKTGWNKWKEVLGLKEEQAIKDYLPHMFEFYKNRDIPKPPGFEYINDVLGKVPLKHLRERLGAPGYILNIEDVYKTYNSWAARYVSTERLRPAIEQAIDRVKIMNPEFGGMAEIYAKNYFGELKEIFDETKMVGQAAKSGFRLAEKASRSVGKTLSDALIANNYSSALANITQGPYFGFSALGLDWGRGVKAAVVASTSKTKEAARLQKLWLESGFDELSNVSFYKEGSTVTDKLIQNLLGTKAMQKIDDISYIGMQVTELFNKKPMYLGAYIKAERIANRVINNPGKHKVWEQWLQQNGIDISKNLDTELFKFAHYETVKAMQDYSRAGQNLFNMLPVTSTLLRVANFPLRAGEVVASNSIRAGNHLRKALFTKNPLMLRTALVMPETLSTLRFGLMSGLGLALAKKSGLSIEKIVGMSNFIVTSSPFLSVAKKVSQGFTAIADEDPAWVKKNLWSLAVSSGFKLTAPAFQIARFMEAVEANKNNPSDKWTVYAGDHRNPNVDIIDQVDPLWYAISILSPINFGNMADYREWIKENADKQRKINNLNKQLDIADFNFETQKANEIDKRRNKLKDDQAKEKEEFLRTHPKVQLRGR